MPETKSERRTAQVWVTPTLRDRLKLLALEEGRATGEIAEDVLSAYVAKEEKRKARVA